MLHLYLAAFVAVVAANVAVIAIALAIRRGPGRFWRLWTKS
jgi:hypothetical protein